MVDAAMNLAFCIPGKAAPWSAPTVRMRRGRNITRSNPRMKAWQEAVHYNAKAAMNGRPPLEGPVELKVVIWVSPPKSWSKEKRKDALAGLIRPAVRPDRSNILKALEDAMQGALYLDDKQVVEGPTSKRYGEPARVVVTITTIDARMP